MSTAKTRNRSTTDILKADGKRAARKAAYSPLMDALARLGYAVRGIMYVTIGAIALQAAIGKTSSPADQMGAITALGSLPSGRILLWVILVGLISYGLWGSSARPWIPCTRAATSQACWHAADTF